MAIYSVKPSDNSLIGPRPLISLMILILIAGCSDYLTQLRVGVYERRYGVALRGEHLGGYGQLDPFVDLMRAVRRMSDQRQVVYGQSHLLLRYSG